MSREYKRYLLVWLIAFMATAAVAEILPIEKGEIFQVILTSIIVAFIIQALAASFYLNNQRKEVSQPTFYLSIVGLFMVFYANYYALKKYYWSDAWMYVIVNIVVLALHYIVLITANTVLNKNADSTEHFGKKAETMRKLTSSAKTLFENTGNKDFERLYEALRYSPQGSNEKTLEIEKQISEQIDQLDGLNSQEDIKERVDNIINLINRRKNTK